MERGELERILNMVSDGTMTPDDAIRLMEAIEGGKTADTTAPVGGSGVKSLKIRVTDLNTGRTKVNMSLPLWLVKGAMKLGGKGFRFSWFGADDKLGGDMTDHLKDLLASGKAGNLLDILDEEENERVEIFVE
jgi:hypothetical protein